MPTIDGGEGEGGVEEAGLGLDSQEVLQQAEQSFSSKLTVFESLFNSRLFYSCGYSKPEPQLSERNPDSILQIILQVFSGWLTKNFMGKLTHARQGPS